MEHALGTLGTGICPSCMGRRYPLEIKTQSAFGGSRQFKDSLRKLLGCMNKCLAEEGWLVVFGAPSKKPWDEAASHVSASAPPAPVDAGLGGPGAALEL